MEKTVKLEKTLTVMNTKTTEKKTESGTKTITIPGKMMETETETETVRVTDTLAYKMTKTRSETLGSELKFRTRPSFHPLHDFALFRRTFTWADMRTRREIPCHCIVCQGLSLIHI